MNILLLEDDLETALTLSRGLRERGYNVEHAASCPEALALVDDHSFQAAILDVMVPGGSGYDVLRALRRRRGDVPVLILTARDAVVDRVGGLERGADDYLVKPFAFAELLARLRALARRPARLADRLQAGPLEIDVLRRSVSLKGTCIELTPTELEILILLAERHGEVLGRRHLLDLLWGDHFDPGANIVEVHVARLCGKLEAAGAHDVIRTVRGVGYVVDA